jgi:hypothetical protein
MFTLCLRVVLVVTIVVLAVVIGAEREPRSSWPELSRFSHRQPATEIWTKYHAISSKQDR